MILLFIYSYIHCTALYQRVFPKFFSIHQQDNSFCYKMFPSDMYHHLLHNNMDHLESTYHHPLSNMNRQACCSKYYTPNVKLRGAIYHVRWSHWLGKRLKIRAIIQTCGPCECFDIWNCDMLNLRPRNWTLWDLDLQWLSLLSHLTHN